MGDVEMTAQAGLARVDHDLLQIGIADQRAVDQTGPQRVRTGKLQR